MKNQRPPLTLSSFFATAYPLGFIPRAPGTWGSIPGLVLGSAIYYLSSLFDSYWAGILLSWTLLGALLALSYWSIKATEAAWDSHDDKRIVIDEVLGQAIPIAFFAYNWIWLVSGFLLFRIFDIAKPGPIGWADRKLPGAWGTLLDDVLAGITVLLLFWIAHKLL